MRPASRRRASAVNRNAKPEPTAESGPLGGRRDGSLRRSGEKMERLNPPPIRENTQKIEYLEMKVPTYCHFGTAAIEAKLLPLSPSNVHNTAP